MILTLTAASGVGKTTFQKALHEAVPLIVHRLTSTTTRPARGDEVSEQYEHVSAAEFDTLAARGEFLDVYEHYGTRYGTRKKLIHAALLSGEIFVCELFVPAVVKFHQYARTHSKQDRIRSVFLDLVDEVERTQRLTRRSKKLKEEPHPERFAAELQQWREKAEHADVDFLFLDAAQRPEALVQQALKAFKW